MDPRKPADCGRVAIYELLREADAIGFVALKSGIEWKWLGEGELGCCETQERTKGLVLHRRTEIVHCYPAR